MKKQRSLRIFLSTAVASSHLALGLPAYSDDGQLQPAPTEAKLRAIPDKDTYVLPVVYLPLADSSNAAGQRKTSVNDELQKLFHQNQNTTGLRTSGTGGSDIQLVQMSSGTATKANSTPTAQPKKSGFFKRLFSSSKKPKQIPGLGEPAPPISKPPAFTYETNASRRSATKNKRAVPATAVSFANTGVNTGQKASSYAPNSSQGGQMGFQNQKASGSNNFLQAPEQRASQAADGFIDPFDSSEMTLEEETLLDLDSLIEGRTTESTPENEVVRQQPLQVAETPLSPTLNQLPVAPQNTKQATPNGPYTGYQLDMNDQVAQQPVIREEPAPAKEILVQTPRVVSQQQNRLEKVEQPSQQVRKLPIIETSPAPASQTYDETQQIPLLEEPEMAIPVVETATDTIRIQEQLQIQSIPLLEEEPVSIPELEEEPQQKQTVVAEPVKQIPPITRSENSAAIKPVDTQRSAAERMAALERQARRDQQAYRIMSRTGQTGFKGFCPVELRDTRQLIDSRKEYKAKFGLQTYYFSSPECKATFEADPARYAPAVGGSDIVLLANTNEEVIGNLDFSLWYRNRLYLFRSRETRKIFAKDPARFADQF